MKERKYSMDNFKFIDQFDPSRDLTDELAGITFQTQYTNLSEREKKLVFLKVNGYNRMPPTIKLLWL